MRVAVHSSTLVGLRAARVLAADPSVDQVGMTADSIYQIHDLPRVPTQDLADWDVMASDAAPNPDNLMGSPVVVYRSDAAPSGPLADRCVVVGANPTVGIGLSLAAVECGRLSSVRRMTLAWTTPGTDLRDGDQVTFPDPIGTRRASPVSSPWPDFPWPADFLVAPGVKDWTGVLVTASGPANGSLHTKTLGVVDATLFLKAIALAAGALAMATADLGPGVHPTFEAAESYVEAAVRSGLGVASYSVDG